MIPKFEEIIAQLCNTVEQQPPSEIEEQRLVRDLIRVTERLSQGEYRQSDFVGNTFNVPDRTKEFYGNFSGYFKHALTWERVLGATNFRAKPRIIDLCPGWAPKLALSLWYSEYAGELLLVDKDREAMSSLLEFMKLLRPKFKLIPTEINLNLCTPGVSAPLVIGNHIADDIALELSSDRFDFRVSDLYASEEAYVVAWRKILSNPGELVELCADTISRALLYCVEPGGYAILTQYQAYMERLLGLSAVVTFAQQIVEAVVRNLCNGDFVNASEKINSALEGFSGVFSPSECWLLERRA